MRIWEQAAYVGQAYGINSVSGRVPVGLQLEACCHCLPVVVLPGLRETFQRGKRQLTLLKLASSLTFVLRILEI